MVKIDFNCINDEIVYEAFHVEGNEAEALNDNYLELFELIGRLFGKSDRGTAEQTQERK